MKNKTKLDELLKAEEKTHDSKTQCEIADLYFADGNDAEADYEEAFIWYRKAADQGNTDAQAQLAHFFYEGIFVQQDDAKAVKWFKKSVESATEPNPIAITRVGQAYENGVGAEQDYAKAFEWYAKYESIDETHYCAYRLWYLCKHGLGTEKDEEKALFWYGKASDWVKDESYVVSCEYCGKEFDINEVTFLEDECAFCCDACMKNKN